MTPALVQPTHKQTSHPRIRVCPSRGARSLKTLYFNPHGASLNRWSIYISKPGVKPGFAYLKTTGSNGREPNGVRAKIMN